MRSLIALLCLFGYTLGGVPVVPTNVCSNTAEIKKTFDITKYFLNVGAKYPPTFVTSTKNQNGMKFFGKCIYDAVSDNCDQKSLIWRTAYQRMYVKHGAHPTNQFMFYEDPGMNQLLATGICVDLDGTAEKYGYSLGAYCGQGFEDTWAIAVNAKTCDDVNMVIGQLQKDGVFQRYAEYFDEESMIRAIKECRNCM